MGTAVVTIVRSRADRVQEKHSDVIVRKTEAPEHVEDIATGGLMGELSAKWLSSGASASLECSLEEALVEASSLFRSVPNAMSDIASFGLAGGAFFAQNKAVHC